MRFLFPVTFFLSMNLMAGAQTFKWAHNSGTWVDDTGLKVISDNNGNFYTTGHVYIGAEFGNFSAPDWGFFLAKYDSTGNTVWARFGGQSYNGIGTSLALDSEGNIYATGSFSHTLDLGDTILNGVHQTSIFLVKYTEYGQLLWAKILGISGSNGWPQGRGLAIDSQDNVYVGTNFSGTLSLEGGVTIPEPYPYYYGYLNIGIVKYTKNGTIVWGKGAAAQYSDNTNIDLLCHYDTLYLAAQLGSGTFKYDNQLYTTGYSGSTSIILVVSTHGNHLWHSATSGSISDIDINSSGELYACGSFYQDFSIDGKYYLHQADGSFANFLIKYSNNRSSVQWTKVIEAGDGSPFVASNDDGVYVGGAFTTSIKVDTVQANSTGMRDIFLLKLSDIGYAQWIRQLSSGWVDDISSVSVNKKGTLTILGHFSGQTLSIDGIDLLNNSGNNNVDMFIASMKDNTVNKCPTFNATLQKNFSLCEGQTAELTSSITDQYTNRPLTWFHDLHQVELTDQIFRTSEAGEYYYIVEADHACADTSNTVSIEVFKKPSTIVSASPKLNVCDGQKVLLHAEHNDSYNYRWFFNGLQIPENDAIIENAESGSYMVTITNGPCTVNSPIQSVHVTTPENNFLPDTLIMCAGNGITLSPTLNSSTWNYSWSTGATTQTTLVSAPETVTLTIDNTYCYFSDQVLVRLSDSKLWIPNVITPNGDGKNDTLIIRKDIEQDVDLTVFNRLGSIVFKTSGYQNDWSPSNLSTGTYYYSVKEKCTKKNLKGWIEVLHE